MRTVERTGYTAALATEHAAEAADEESRAPRTTGAACWSRRR